MFGINKKRGTSVAGVLAAICLASPASAATFLFTFDGATIDAAGTLTTEDVPTGTGGFLITGITGTANGTTITSLLAPGGFASNDNLLFAGQTPLLSFGGFSFVADGLNSNIFFSSGGQTFGFFQSVAVSSPGTFTISAVTNPPPVGAIPEPGTWALMLMGFGVVGAAMRRRPRAKVTVSYA